MSAKHSTCGHSEAKHFGRGMCYPCYVVWLRESGEGRKRTDKWRKDNREKHLAQSRKINNAKYRTDAGWRGHRNSTLKGKYGITLETFESLVRLQGGVCAICKRGQCYGKKRLTVDHNHLTGVVRGLLCQRCNVMIGHGRDNPDLLKAAIAYLEK